MKSQNSAAIDVEFLRGIVDNDHEFEKELLGIFMENAGRNLTKMEEALSSGDNNAWYMSSHAFKGASASIGAFNLSQLLEYAQKHPDENAEQKAKVIAQVKEEFAAVQEFIKSKLQS